MGKTLLAAAVLALAFAAPSVAMGGSDPAQGQTGNFEQKKADVLKMFDQRIADMQDGRSCVQAAQSHDDLKACRDKQMAAMEQKRKETGMGMQNGSGGQGGPPTGR